MIMIQLSSLDDNNMIARLTSQATSPPGRTSLSFAPSGEIFYNNLRVYEIIVREIVVREIMILKL